MTHTCHAIGCETPVAPRLFMCARHWRIVPRALQRAIWAVYIPGQERLKNPTRQYLETSSEVICWLALREGYAVRNSHAAACCICGGEVPPGAGLLAANVGVVRGWNVKHDDCAFKLEIGLIDPVDEEDPLS